MLNLVKDINYYKDKYQLEFEGITRYYKVDINDRMYGCERCVPHYLEIGTMVWEGNTWQKLLFDLFHYLQSTSPKSIDELKAFKVDWSKAKLFDDHKFMSNCMEVGNNLFMSFNFTGAHYSWFVCDLIKFYGLESHYKKLLIHIPTMNEPLEIQKDFKLINVELFKEYLKNKGLNEKSIEITIKNINILNKGLGHMNSGMNDFFLCNDLKRFKATQSRLMAYIRLHHLLPDAQIAVANSSLLKLYNFIKNS